MIWIRGRRATSRGGGFSGGHFPGVPPIPGRIRVNDRPAVRAAYRSDDAEATPTPGVALEKLLSEEGKCPLGNEPPNTRACDRERKRMHACVVARVRRARQGSVLGRSTDAS